MKKLLGISLVAAFAVAPMMGAMADPAAHNADYYALQDGITDGTKGTDNQTTDSNETQQADLTKGTGTPVAEGGKYFAGKSVSVADAGIVATGAYVKGAYNAAISAVNAVAETADTNKANIGTLDSLTTTEKSSLVGAINEVAGNVSDNFATKTGVVNTIESATVHTLNSVSVASSGVTAYTDWADDTATATVAQTTLSTSEAYVPVVITATESTPNSGTYDVKYHTTKVDVASDTSTSPNTYVANP